MNITIEQIKETVNRIHLSIGGPVEINLKTNIFRAEKDQKHQWELWSGYRSEHYRFASWESLLQWVSDLENSPEKIIIEETLDNQEVA